MAGVWTILVEGVLKPEQHHRSRGCSLVVAAQDLRCQICVAEVLEGWCHGGRGGTE